MGFRFRKSLKILPGVRVNVSKSGTSVSIGGKGATVNLSERGVRSTISIPGTGISYSENVKYSHQESKVKEEPKQSSNNSGLTIGHILTFIFLIWLIYKLFMQ